MIGNTLFIMLLVLVFVFALIAIMRGYKGMKMNQCFETTNHKVRMGYKAASVIHMGAGILIILFYMIAGTLILVFI